MDKSWKPSWQGSVLCAPLEICGRSVVGEVVQVVVQVLVLAVMLAVVCRHLSLWWWWWELGVG
jgi:hypothetical protein